ncbi:hypothetical protein [Treponema sp. R6D11]
MDRKRSTARDTLLENEMLKLFQTGVLLRTIKLAVCAIMFLSNLRQAEIFALKPEDLDWVTPKITVKRAWQNFDNKEKRILEHTKGKKNKLSHLIPSCKKP